MLVLPNVYYDVFFVFLFINSESGLKLLFIQLNHFAKFPAYFDFLIHDGSFMDQYNQHEVIFDIFIGEQLVNRGLNVLHSFVSIDCHRVNAVHLRTYRMFVFLIIIVECCLKTFVVFWNFFQYLRCMSVDLHY